MAAMGTAPTRGFGGRIYFFDQHNNAVPAAGKLVVYAFKDEGDLDADRPPDRKYVFPAEDFSRHYSESNFGASYSVWVPWDAVGGEQCNISLIPIFTTVEGKVVVGDQSRHILPGRAPLVQSESSHTIVPTNGDPKDIETIDYESELESTPTFLRDGDVARASTIRVPSAVHARLLRGPNSPSLPTDESLNRNIGYNDPSAESRRDRPSVAAARAINSVQVPASAEEEIRRRTGATRPNRTFPLPSTRFEPERLPVPATPTEPQPVDRSPTSPTQSTLPSIPIGLPGSYPNAMNASASPPSSSIEY